MDDLLYIKDGKVVASDMAMEIPSFKMFRRYDSSTNKSYFNNAMSYIYYVYNVYGENKSYLFNLPLIQRKRMAVMHHTGSSKSISDFDDNKWVVECVDDFIRYSMTPNERMFDALKDDIERFISYVEKIPHTFKKKVVVYKRDPDTDSEVPYDVEIDVPFVTGRIEALKQASDLNDLYLRKQADVNRDQKAKRSTGRLFEDKDYSSKIPLSSIPISSEK